MRISDWSSDVCSSDLPQHLVRLRRQSPARAIEHQRDRRLAIGGGLGIVLGLDQEMAEIPSFQRRRIAPVLRPDQLQFVAFALDDLAPRLWADAHPVDRGMTGPLPVGPDPYPQAAAG